MNLYIHVPFCAQRCSYCDFYTQTQLGLRDVYVEALLWELQLRASEVGEGDAIRHIYFGGGTPSLLKPSVLSRIFEQIHKYYRVEQGGEITLEANPDDVTEAYVSALASLPINRISMGVQSFQSEDLRFLNRRHTAGQVYQAVDTLRRYGIDELSLDLIYGLPGQSERTWADNLEQIVALSVPHISAYHLIYEEGTPLMRLKEQGKVKEVSEEDSLRFLGMLIERLSAEGYEHYEISNFARGGHYAKLNTGYWQGEHYLGFGPAAHSYNGKVRSYNVASVRQYTEALDQGRRPSSEEVLSERDIVNEYSMTRLRTMWGVSLREMTAMFGESVVQRLLSAASEHLSLGNLLLNDESLRLSPRGIFISDSILVDLFV